MRVERYEWKRRWLKQGGEIHFDSNGLLPPPDSYPRNPHIVDYERIRGIPALALLGEPGTGKSDAIRKIRDASDPAHTAFINLAQFNTDVGFQSALDGDSIFKQWLASKTPTTLLLDSLDECQVPTIATLLAERLQQLETVEGLFIRIACRTADWPPTLNAALEKRWEEQFQRYEIAPLARDDIELAARAKGLDPEAFLDEVIRRELSALAAMPITLVPLLEAYPHLPRTKREAYGTAIQLLASEQSHSRKAAKQTGKLSPGQRVLLAERVAALTQLCGRNAVYVGPPGFTPVENALTIQEIAGGREPSGTDHADATEDALVETLSTGLFSSAGETHRTWYHWSYSEFLAARYLYRQGFSPQQLSDLLFTEDTVGRRRVLPHLREVAAWLANDDAEFLAEVLRTEPEVLLSPALELEKAGPKLKLEVARQYLDAVINGVLNDDLSLRTRYSGLAAPGLASVLQPYLNDGSTPVQARRAALEIAAEASVQGLDSELVRLALYASEPLLVREYAAWAIQRMGAPASRLALRPLLSPAPDDEQENLRGHALTALWPAHLSTQEVLATLSPPRRENYYGVYHDFLHRTFPQGLDSAGLALALQRQTQREDRLLAPNTETNFGDALVERALELAMEPGVVQTLAPLLCVRAAHHRPLLENEPWRALAPEARHAVLDAVGTELARRGEGFDDIHAVEPNFLEKRDLEWLVGRALSDPDHRKLWVEAAGLVLDLDDRRQVDFIIESAAASPLLAEAFRPVVGPIDLESDLGVAMRRHGTRRNRQPTVVTPAPPERIAVSLRRFEEGAVAAWEEMAKVLSGPSQRLDLTRGEAWKALPEPLREAVVRAAGDFLDRAESETAAGVQALALLATKAPARFQALSPGTWPRWAKALLRFPGAVTGLEMPLQRRLLRQVVAYGVETLTETVMKEVELRRRSGQPPLLLRQLDGVHCRQLSLALSARALAPPALQPDLLRYVLENLLRSDPEIGTRTTLQVLESTSDPRTRKTVMAIFIRERPNIAWPELWPSLRGNHGLAKDVLELVVSATIRDRSAYEGVPAPLIADIYLALRLWYPPSTDPVHHRAHVVGTRESIVELRDSAITVLRRMGTPEAVAALRRIRDRFPSPEISFTVTAAEEAFLQNARSHLSPQHLLTMAESKRRRRYVLGSDSLRSTVMQELRILGEELQRGEAPKAQWLWNTSHPRSPKQEEALSDYTKQVLERELNKHKVVVNREVQINLESHTDIHLVVPGGEHHPDARAIVEVKGAWNREVLTSLEAQLCTQYLARAKTNHGVYLVYWFDPAALAPGSRKHRPIGGLTREELQRELDQQATRARAQGYFVDALVLDATLPPKRTRPKSHRARRRRR